MWFFKLIFLTEFIFDFFLVDFFGNKKELSQNFVCVNIIFNIILTFSGWAFFPKELTGKINSVKKSHWSKFPFDVLTVIFGRSIRFLIHHGITLMPFNRFYMRSFKSIFFQNFLLVWSKNKSEFENSDFDPQLLRSLIYN